MIRQLARTVLSNEVRAGLLRFEASLRNSWVRSRSGLVLSRYPWRSYADPMAHVFFGYHDISPFDQSGTYVLAHRVALDADPVRDPADICVVSLDNGEFRRLGTTDVWCWQMGARLRWLDDHHVSWNILLPDGEYGSVICSSHTGKELSRFSVPLYDIDKTCTYGLSLDFSRLQRLRPGYGYSRKHDDSAGDRVPCRSGIDLVDLRTGGSSLIVTLAEIVAVDPHPTMRCATHYLNHLSFSPDGSRLCVLHIWISEDGKRRVRLLVYDLGGKLVFFIPGQVHISHFGWLQDGCALIAFAKLPGDIAEQYQVIDITSGSIRPLYGFPEQDGHPMLRPLTVGRRSDNTFVCDTYPDRNSFRSLYICGSDTSAGPFDVAQISSPPFMTGERRCDLHPRWSADGNLISIDSAHKRRREMLVFDVSSVEVLAC